MQNHKDNQLINDENAVINVSIMSVIGDRDEQQDCFGYLLKVNEGIVVVCDGMGGHEGGQIASSISTESFISDYENCTNDYDPEQQLILSAKTCDKKISELKHTNGEKMNAGSTCVGVIIRGKMLYWCSVGDSRAYLLRGDEFVQLTQDHNYGTVLNEKKRAGIITEEQFEKEWERREALISYLGIGNLSLIDYNNTPFQLEKDDKIVIMSDGLYKLVDDIDIHHIVDNFTNSSEALRALDMKANRCAKNKRVNRDNMTVAIITIR